MKKTAWDFGSSWEVAHSGRRLDDSAETTCDSQYDYLGFRLVHDDADLLLSGGCWYNVPLYARVAHRLRFDPARRGDSLGFRLVFSQEET